MLSALYWLGFALAASPGPDFFLILRHSLTHGRRMGYVTLAGNRLSLCLHMTFAILGLSVILQQSTTLFAGVRLLGAAYLQWETVDWFFAPLVNLAFLFPMTSSGKRFSPSHGP